MTNTKYSQKMFFLLVMVFTLFAVQACDDEDKKDILEEENLVEILKKYKWKNENVSDWHDTSYGGYYETSTNILYFLDHNVGYEYQVIRNYDTDLDESKDTWFDEFTYSVSENNVTTRYKSTGNTATYTYNYGYLLWGEDCYYERMDLTQNDRDFINSKIEESTPQTGKCGTNLTYSYNKKTQELVISGSGDMYDYNTNSMRPWNGLYVSTLTIKEGVTSVGDNFFNGITNSVDNLDLPSSLKRIGNSAFAGMFIDNVSIPASVIEIGTYAFNGCKYLESIYIPISSKLQTIGDYAFYDCSKLKETYFTLPASVKTVGDFAFISATFKNITLNEGLEAIGGYAFGDGITGDVKIPNSVKKIGSCAFSGSFSKIVLGTGIQELNFSFFSTASSGRIYVNQGAPLDISDEFIGSDALTSTHKKWTLYVPKGCKSAYSKKSPWNKFKAIYEDDTLEGGNSGGSDEEEEENNDNDEGGDYTGTVNGHEWVDLGLSVKWATCNVGASSPEEYGDLYAWGETTTKSDYDWDTYKWCNGTWDYLTKYCTESYYGAVDYRRTLTSSDDVATVKWGSRWRMPTKEEFDELIADCIWTWSSSYLMRGYMVKGPNGNSIFLPSAGYVESGNYWSATLCEYDTDAYAFTLSDKTYSWSVWGDRCYGRVVRPITE